MAAPVFFRCFVTLPLMVAVSAAIADEGVPTSAQRILSVVDSVLLHHIEPPTRQQMILQGARTAYRNANVSIPRDLSQAVSALTGNEQLGGFLADLESSLDDNLPEFENKFLDGMLASLPGRAHRIDAEEVRVQSQVAANRYVGIGIALTMIKEIPTINRLFYDGPGRRSGALKNDQILHIDGEPTAGKSLKQVIDELRGEEGSVVSLRLKQPNGEPRDLDVPRGVTFIPTIEGSVQQSPGKWDYTVESAPEIGLLRIRHVGPSTIHELKKIEAQLRSEQLRGLVLDLRGGGGIMHDVVMFADQFLDGGTIGYEESTTGIKQYKALRNCLFGDIPIAVLVARFASPDRVFLAAALQDQARAVVIGEPNNQPVFVRRHITLGNNEQLLLATGRLQRGNGTTLTAFPSRPGRHFLATPRKRERHRTKTNVLDAQLRHSIPVAQRAKKAISAKGSIRYSKKLSKS